MSFETNIESNFQIQLQRKYPWIDNSLFENLLRSDFPSGNIVVKSYLLKAALGKGENYMSQMIRAIVNYTIDGAIKQINFIIKAAMSSEGLDENMVNERKEMFNKEIGAYDEVLTKVDELLKEIGDKTKLHGR